MDLNDFFNSILDQEKISIEELSLQIKVPKKFLKNLQDGNYEDFPVEVYVRGYFNELALFFKIDKDEFFSRYDEINLTRAENTEYKYDTILNLEHKSNKVQIIVLLLAFIALITGILYIFSVKNINRNSNIKHSKTLQNNLKQTNHQISVADNGSKNFSDNLTENNNINIIADNVSNNGNVSQYKTAKSSFLNNNQEEDNESLADNASDRLVVVATDKVWLKINSDNKTVKIRTLLKDQKIELTGNKFFKIDIGNSGGVKIYINGKDYPVKGKRGEVKHIFIDLKKL